MVKTNPPTAVSGGPISARYQPAVSTSMLHPDEQPSLDIASMSAGMIPNTANTTETTMAIAVDTRSPVVGGARGAATALVEFVTVEHVRDECGNGGTL